MKDYRDLLAEKLQDPKFKAEYDALEPEYAAIKAVLRARNESEITQKELSERSGVSQADISRIENGNGNPSVRILSRLAQAMDMHLKIEFVPN